MNIIVKYGEKTDNFKNKNYKVMKQGLIDKNKI